MLKNRNSRSGLRVPSFEFTRAWVCLLWLVSFTTAISQTLNVPPRPADAPNGTQFTNIVTTLSRDERESRMLAEIVRGNVPNFLRTLKPISVSSGGHSATYYVTPDYLAIGDDADYFLAPMTPLLAQRLCDLLGYTLPTRKMVNQIWTNAAVKMTPRTIGASPEMTTVPVFAWHNFMVRTQRNGFTNSFPLGALVGGNKKDVIISARIYTNFATPSITETVVIYGWHQTSGSPIQPLYNGHEETYADYSHGVRLVQMSLTVDGNANTVTNVLKTPALAPVLSDDSASEGTSGGIIPLPRYTIAPQVFGPPRSQTDLPGTAVTFFPTITGSQPLAYRWRFNGVNITAATNASFSLTNIVTTNAGSYSIVASNSTGSVTSRVAVLRVRTNSYPVMFADNFDTNSSANWNLFWGATNGVPDYDVDWAFDYGVLPYTFNGVTALIPPAPNSPDGNARAVRLAVNQNDASAVIAAVNLYPKNRSFSGNFALKFDLWIQYPGNAGGAGAAGSTQHALFGINHLSTNVNWHPPTATASDGLWFGVDGEGGDNKDYRAYSGNLAGTQNDLVAAGTSGLAASNNVLGIFPTLFSATRFETVGAPGKNWVEVEVRYTNNIVQWLMDGTLIGQRNNSPTFTNGNIMIGLMDVFNSIAAPARDSFVLFDNLRVENLTPQPIHLQSATRLPNGHISLTLTNMPGDNYFLDASSNLNSWQQLSAILATNSTFTFIDSNAPAFSARYYRTRR